MSEQAYNHRILVQVLVINRNAKTVWDLDELGDQSQPDPGEPAPATSLEGLYRMRANSMLVRPLMVDPERNNIEVETLGGSRAERLNFTYVGWAHQFDPALPTTPPVPQATVQPRCSDAIGCNSEFHLRSCPHYGAAGTGIQAPEPTVKAPLPLRPL